MPIYEFKCLTCNDIFELLLMHKNRPLELRCPKCRSEDVERVLSAAGYAMGGANRPGESVISQSRTCPGGACTTYDIPGPK